MNLTYLTYVACSKSHCYYEFNKYFFSLFRNAYNIVISNHSYNTTE